MHQALEKGNYFFLNEWTREGMAELVLAPDRHCSLWSAGISSWVQSVWSPEIWLWAVRDHTAQVCCLKNNAIEAQLREWGAFSRWM